MPRIPALLLAFLVLLVPTCAALAPAMAAGAPRGDSDLARWNEGPVRYLLRRSEEKMFQSLKDDASRALFVRRFWESRDPDPSDSLNEARAGFWERVAQANEIFRDSVRPGWMTDRGRIHILLGPPRDIQQDLDFHYRSGDVDTRGILRWTYTGEVESGRNAGPAFIIAFYQDASAEWRLTTDPKLTSPTFDPLAARNMQGGPQLPARLAQAIASSQSPLAAAMDLARITAPPGDEVALIESVASDAFYVQLPMAARWDFFPGDGIGQTLVVATIFVKKKDMQARQGAEASSGANVPPGLVLLGRFEPAGGSPRSLAEDSFSLLDPAGSGESLVYQARFLAGPGSAATYLGLFDPDSGRAGRDRRTVEVPAFPRDSLRISSLLPAARLSPVTRSSEQGYILPFVMGNQKVAPLAEPVFSRSGEFAVYFQLDSSPAAPPRELRLQFFRIQEGIPRPAGAPQVVKDPPPVQGWTFPISAWPPGAYRLVVTVTGGDPEAKAERSLDFRIE